MLPYACTIFLSAFLLFLVQPLIAKQILPWFGGSAAVWTTCLLFFQSVLLAGYAYADGVVRFLKPRQQTFVHLALLAVSLAFLPIVADPSWKPTGEEDPILRILALLSVAIGLPYLMLSATTPLLQAWYWRRHQSAVPYRLFALSNFASLLALLGYPVLVEPWFGGLEVARYWSVLYAVFAVVCGATGLLSLRAAAAAAPAADGSAPAAATTTQPATKISAGTLGLWLLLPGMGSALLLAVSNHITQNVASVPFLWVVPLALYLITFIICFDHPRWYTRVVFVPLLWVAVPLMAWMADSRNLEGALSTFTLGLFVICMVCHGELARRKPDPSHLTLYYLMMSLGGALGALVVAIIAPLTLHGYFEMPIGLVLMLVLATGLLWKTPVAVRLASVAAVGASCWFSWQWVESYTDGVRMMERDFYGVVRTRDRTDVYPIRVMIHGATNHGGQLLGEGHQMDASSYFAPTSGFGRYFRSTSDAPRRIGVIGLGAGAMAAHARAGDEWVFYEISPAVVRITEKEFTFLQKSPAKNEIVLGDGRLALEREPSRQFDMLAIDAFSGNSIPMHLLTREALQAYLKHIKPDGAIIFQATNRFVNILPVIRRLADDAGLYTAHVSDEPDFESGPEYWRSSTDQVIVTRNKALLESPAIKEAAQPAPQREDLQLFTDDFYNLLRILK